MNINPENKSKDNDNYHDLDDDDSALINYGKKSLKKQIFDNSQELLDIDTKNVSTNNSFNFGKTLMGLFILIMFIIVVYSIFAAVIEESNTFAVNIVFILSLICVLPLVGIIFHYITKNK